MNDFQLKQIIEYFSYALSSSRTSYAERMKIATRHISGIQTFAEKTKGLIFMDREQVNAFDVLQNDKALINEHKEESIKKIKVRQVTSPWFT